MTPGCGPDCPCRLPRVFGWTWTVFSTAVTFRLVRSSRRGRVQWFRWVA